MSMQLKHSRGNRRVFIQIGKTSQSTRRGIRRAWYFVGKDLTKGSKRSIIEGPKTGRLYRIKGRKRKHRASAPGEPPANLSGALQKSVDFKVLSWRKLEFRAGTPYAAALELGFRKRNLEPRPFMFPQIERQERNTTAHLEREVRNSLLKSR